MNKKFKFLVLVQSILLCRQIKEKQFLQIIEESMEVPEKEIWAGGDKLKNCAIEFVEWRLLNWNNPFESAPKNLSKETIGRILVG